MGFPSFPASFLQHRRNIVPLTVSSLLPLLLFVTGATFWKADLSRFLLTTNLFLLLCAGHLSLGQRVSNVSWRISVSSMLFFLTFLVLPTLLLTPSPVRLSALSCHCCHPCQPCRPALLLILLLWPLCSPPARKFNSSFLLA